MVGTEFGGRLKLVAVRLASAQLVLGEPLTVDLHWQALVPLNQDLRAFLELVDENGVEVAGDDDVIGTRSNPTSGWPIGGEGGHQPRATVPIRSQVQHVKVRVGALEADRVTRIKISNDIGASLSDDSVEVAEFSMP